MQPWTADGLWATASLNLTVPLADDLIAIKDWRENAAVLVALIEAGIVQNTGGLIPVGYELAKLCVILAREYEGEMGVWLRWCARFLLFCLARN